MAKTIATFLGALFILVGLIGFAAPGLLGAHLSPVHNVVHLVTGAAALYLGLMGSLSAARMFCLVFGIVYLLLGAAGFLLGSPGTEAGHSETLFRVIPGMLELGTMDHIIHILLGAIFVIGALMTKPAVTADA